LKGNERTDLVCENDQHNDTPSVRIHRDERRRVRVRRAAPISANEETSS
jgi:hypothetical protein